MIKYGRGENKKIKLDIKSESLIDLATFYQLMV